MCRSSRLRKPLICLGVLLCLMVHAILGGTSILNKSNTYDEPAYLVAGYAQWKLHDYRLMPQNGLLPERWIALPLLGMNLNFRGQESPGWNHSDIWRIGYDFLFKSGNDADAILLRARMMILAVSCLLGLIVFLAARHWFGVAGGFVSLILYTLEPSIIANGRMATSDLFAAITMTCPLLIGWAMMHRLNWWTLVGGGLALAAAMLSKFSAPVLVPILLVMLGLRLARRSPLIIHLQPLLHARIRPRIQQVVLLAGALIIQGVLVIVLIWAAFGFRYSTFAHASASAQFEAPWDEMLQSTGLAGSLIGTARAHHLLPEAYLYGFTFVLQHAQTRQAFLNGEYSLTGWWYFFPYAFLIKTALSSLAVLLLAGGAWFTLRTKQLRKMLYRTAPCWIFIAVFGVMLMTSHLNIGQRHMLPIYPVLFILAGAAGWWFARRQQIMKWAVGVALAFLMIESVMIWPDYLAYFNALAGGPSQGYRHLADSSLDWGQDLPGLRQWLDANKLNEGDHEPVYLSYFGTGSPAYYGIHARRLENNGTQDTGPERINEPLEPGYYCISASMVDGLYLTAWGHWTHEYEQLYQTRAQVFQIFLKEKADPTAFAAWVAKIGQETLNKILWEHSRLRMARLCAYLRQRNPDAMVGYSILIYHLSADDLREALFGLPAELYDHNYRPD